MNWKTIKTFLIFLFLAVDIFLIVMTYNFYNSGKLSDQSIQDTLNLLQKNNISVDAEIIPRGAAGKNSIQLTNIYFSDIYGKKKIMTINDDRVSMELPCNTSGLNKTNAVEMIKSTLKNYGFDTDNISVNPLDSNQYIMTYSVDGMPVFNNSMTITVNDSSIQLCGTWYINETENTYTGNQTGSSYATSALIDFISHPERNKDEGVTITDIDLGYYADVSSGTANIKIISASPCYRLTTDTKKVYYYSIHESKFIN